MADNDDRIARLAQQIESATRREDQLHLTPAQARELRGRGAAELHAICMAFAASVNRLLPDAVIEVSPASYTADLYREPGTNLFQINARGRIMQLAVQATASPLSTDKFVTPYILEGELRMYNQESLEHFRIRTVALFYCLENEHGTWRYSDWVNNRLGIFGRDLLVDLMERLI